MNNKRIVILVLFLIVSAVISGLIYKKNRVTETFFTPHQVKIDTLYNRLNMMHDQKKLTLENTITKWKTLLMEQKKLLEMSETDMIESLINKLTDPSIFLSKKIEIYNELQRLELDIKTDITDSTIQNINEKLDQIDELLTPIVSDADKEILRLSNEFIIKIEKLDITEFKGLINTVNDHLKEPTVTTPAVTTPAVTTPAVTTGATLATPAVTTGATLATPAVATPAVTTGAVTTPAVTTGATPAIVNIRQVLSNTDFELTDKLKDLNDAFDLFIEKNYPY
jgi:hypothetical protein